MAGDNVKERGVKECTKSDVRSQQYVKPMHRTLWPRIVGFLCKGTTSGSLPSLIVAGILSSTRPCIGAGETFGGQTRLPDVVAQPLSFVREAVEKRKKGVPREETAEKLVFERARTSCTIVKSSLAMFLDFVQHALPFGSAAHGIQIRSSMISCLTIYVLLISFSQEESLGTKEGVDQGCQVLCNHVLPVYHPGANFRIAHMTLIVE
jgi:hypothetical protein